MRPNAVGLGGAVIMSAALMGPAVSVYFKPQVATQHAGLATPLVFAAALARFGIGIHWTIISASPPC